MQTVKDFIDHYKLEIHPEGGYYRETYRSAESIAHAALPGRFTGERSFSTAIYFLLEKGNFSAFHRIKSDECWHFYAGNCLLVHVGHENGDFETIKLGSNISNRETFQFVVPAGCWFAAEPAQNSKFSFVGCTVSPGFDFADFELANADGLSRLFPQHETIIRRLTR